MEGQFSASREDLYHISMEVKHVQAVQNNHTDRILRLEKRQADDAALKSVWNSPFPSVMGGTPQHGPIQTPSADVFDDFDDEQGQNLLGSLHLEAEEEPVRRGASRANSVRFDVSAIHGANWASAGSRSSGDFGPVRPNSGFGGHPIERSSSHKSDGRHSSAGHSVHSGRTSSLGLDTNFLIGNQDDDSSVDMPEPPPGLFILGSVPAIIRCWLNDTFSHNALLYADVCTGSQKSTLEYSLVKELGLVDAIHKDGTGASLLRLPIYLPEAIVTNPSSRANSPAPQLPTLTATFEVTGLGRLGSINKRKTIRVFIGSDTLRAHNADILFSQNVMLLYGDDRNKLTIPFVRPEDDTIFKHIITSTTITDKIELKATALPFRPGEIGAVILPDSMAGTTSDKEYEPLTPGIEPSLPVDIPNRKTVKPERDPELAPGASESDTTSQIQRDRMHKSYDGEKRESGSIWGSWRTGGVVASTEADVSRDSTQRNLRGGSRSMKVLKPSHKTSTGRSASAARTGSLYEPPVSRLSGESRRKSQAGFTESNGTLRWESKKPPVEDKSTKEPKIVPNVSKSSNPVGGASAFAWMNPTRSKSSTTTVD